jgi:2-keto-4-pentenoate hydratase/2-oxohepta-3-ene-1,7-dioic acid hydratase in catechol pathway
MRICFFDDFRLGIIKGNGVVDVTDATRDIAHTMPQQLMAGLIQDFERYREALVKAADRGKAIPTNRVRMRPPLPKPSNIDCMAVNYMEDGTRKEPAPINAFLKTSNAIIGDGDTMILPDVPATIFEGEAELALVIGSQASNVPQAKAMQHVFGYVNFVDGSARGLPPDNNSFYQMKSRDTFAPIGPYIVTADEVPDPLRLQVRLWNNGILMQDYNTSDMAHKIPRCIEWVSSIHTMEAGDILALGTNHGGLNPFMDGDSVEMEIEKLGRLHFNVKDGLKRVWARETRGERQKKSLPGTTPQIAGKYATG